MIVLALGAFLVVTILVAVVLILLARAPGSPASVPGEPEPAPIKPDALAAPPVRVDALPREQLAQKLRALADSPPPAGPMHPGACCYAPRALPDSAEYLCPRCQAKTQHSKDVQLASQVNEEIPAIRKQLARIRELDVQVDESEFCAKCQPNRGARRPQLVLVVRYPDGSNQRTPGASLEDVKLLADFSEGKDVHNENDFASPLKNHLPRLHELLGIEDKAAPAPGKKEP